MMRNVRQATFAQQQLQQLRLPRLPVRVLGKAVVGRQHTVSVSAIASPSTDVTTHQNGNGNSNSNGNGAYVTIAQPVASYGAAPQITIPEPIPGMQPPPKIFEIAVATGIKKANLPIAKTLVLGMLAGAFISVGAAVVFTVGANCPGIAAANPGLQKMLMGVFGLPTFLTMAIVSGAELFTGNTALVTMAAFEGKATTGQLIKNWVVSYIGNVLGAAFVVTLLYQSGIFATATAPLAIATAKSTLTFTQALLRGIACNWLVCMAVWQATGATTFPGKFLSAVLPVSAFVSLGLEHSVANMFMIPMGIALGAPVSVGQFLVNNLIPVTLGNIIGGAVLVGMAFSFAYGRLGKAKQA